MNYENCTHWNPEQSNHGNGWGRCDEIGDYIYLSPDSAEHDAEIDTDCYFFCKGHELK